MTAQATSPDPFPFSGWGLGTRLEFRSVLYADHMRFHSRRPYIERLPTL